MKTGHELIKLNIERNGYLFFEVRNRANECVYPCAPSRSTDETLEHFEQVCDTLPAGNYTVVLSKEADTDKGRVKRQSQGAGGAVCPLNIFATKSHIDVNSHNATAIQPVGFKEYEQLRNEVERLKIELLKAEIKANNTQDEKQGIFDKIIVSPHGEQLVNVATIAAINVLSNMFVPQTINPAQNGAANNG